MGNCIKKLVLWFRPSRIYNISGQSLRQVCLLSEGGYGFIYMVMDLQSGLKYALKKQLCQTNQQHQLYSNQVQVMKACIQCPFIIHLYGTHTIKRSQYLQTYILMQLASQSLYDKIIDHYEFTQLQIIKYMLEIAQALQFLHEKGYTHYDIKVQNILISKNGTALLCDFGSSKKTYKEFPIPKSKMYELEEQFQRCSTLMYRAPQMIDLCFGYPIDERVDIWMLGCVLYILNYGMHPFQESGKLSIINAKINYKQCVSKKMQMLMRHILTPNPQFRPWMIQLIVLFQQWEKNNSIQINEVAQCIMKHEQLIRKQYFQQAKRYNWREIIIKSEQFNQYQQY